MNIKYLACYSAGLLLFALCFFLSLLTVPATAGGFIPEFHPASALYALIALIFGADIIKRSRTRLTALQSVYVLAGLSIGTIGILNVVLVNPRQDQGLFVPWLIMLVAIFYFRNFLFPFHLKGISFVKNIAFGAGILFVFKLFILFSVVTKIPGVPSFIEGTLAPSVGYTGYYDLKIMSMIWMVGIIMYASGVFVLKQAFGGQNNYNLRQVKNELGLESSDMRLLGIKNEEIIGMTLEQVDDVINSRVREIQGNYFNYAQLENLANKNGPEREKNGKIWVNSVSGLLEYKPVGDQNIKAE
jgi:hypothetical protein